jgi:hypothetical protein
MKGSAQDPASVATFAARFLRYIFVWAGVLPANLLLGYLKHELSVQKGYGQIFFIFNPSSIPQAQNKHCLSYYSSAFF